MEHPNGYAYGQTALESSPVSVQEPDLLKQTLSGTAADDRFLHMAGRS